MDSRPSTANSDVIIDTYLESFVHSFNDSINDWEADAASESGDRVAGNDDARDNRDRALDDDGEGKPPAVLYYRMADTGPWLLKEVLEGKGWKQYDENEGGYWNLWWKGSRYRASDYENCMPWQRMNHFPKTAVITRKDSLFRTLKTLRGIHGSIYDFFPQSFSLPNDYVRFVRVYAEEEERGEKVIHRADLSRGRKIFVFRDLQDLTYDCNAVLQRYIPNPLLIAGYKFDIRCYVVVRSYNPLNIYLYDEGLTRFATSLYDTNSLKNKFSHLTNTSINKFSPTLLAPKVTVGQGCKWTLQKLREYFKYNNLPFDKIWAKVKAIIILTLLPVALEVKPSLHGCFEMYGFDILIDDMLRPWLLEVNLSPALSVDADVDIDVKKPLLEDIVSLVGIGERDAEDAMTFMEEQVMLKSITRRSRRKNGETVSVRKLDLQCPNRVGQLTKIYPFNAVTERARFGSKTPPPIKTVLQEIKKVYITPSSQSSSSSAMPDRKDPSNMWHCA
ncbi:putative tubulin polyglutamylase ttll2 [Blyttiomyces sp. JEL0837]|nr:putative tubulin polyglutamylase ttll2 [Blyttiomyces sp. JEL0837]